MNLPDVINGVFEMGGGLMVGMNCWRIYRDKKILGMSTAPTAFFMLWGYWNLYFYPAVNAWMSFVGGAVLVVMNTIYMGQLVYYLWWKK